jgi:hypothetical protein
MTDREIVQNMALSLPYVGEDCKIAHALLMGQNVAEITESLRLSTPARVLSILSDDRFKNYVASHVQNRVILADAIALETLMEIMQDQGAKDSVRKDCAKIISDRSQKISDNQRLTDGTDPEDMTSDQLRQRLSALIKESEKRAKDATPNPPAILNQQ